LQPTPKIILNVKRTAQKKGVTLIQPPYVKIPILSRISAWFAYWWLIPWVIYKWNISHILLYGVATNGPQVIIWSKIIGIPVHFRALDVTHQLVPNHWLKLPAQLTESFVYRHSNSITAISPMLTQYINNITQKTTPAKYLPSGSDNSLFYPQPKNHKLLKKIGISKHDNVLIFAGTLYNFSGLDVVIKAFPKWLKQTPHLRLIIVGRGEQETSLKALTKKLELSDQIVFTGFIQYEMLPQYINLADIGINPFRSNAITDRIFPGKMYQYVACGKPTISSQLPGVMNIFPPNTDSHGIFYYTNMKEFIKMVLKLKGKKISQDPNPSLQDISLQIESELHQLPK
jgi:glycosyltransferase involved in cell wall biosynthesis